MLRVALRIAELAPHLVAQQMAVNNRLLVGSCAPADLLPLTQYILDNFSPPLTACCRGDSVHALYFACDWGSLPHVELLLAHGAPVNQETTRGAPIHAAAVRGRLDIVERLLAHGATVDPAVRWKSHTPVMLAARGGPSGDRASARRGGRRHAASQRRWRHSSQALQPQLIKSRSIKLCSLKELSL